ncbi:MAG: POTRA domain-containing protein [Candidatus Latescibacterota bacterium]
MPLTNGSWWRYSRDGKALTLRVTGTRTEFGQTIATLAFDTPEGAPFGSIDVYETDRGLYLFGINRSFLGRDLIGIILNPPRLWLPYHPEDAPVTGGDIIGTVRIVDSSGTVETPAGKMNNVITYLLENGDRPDHRIQLAPGIGFVALNGALLVESNPGEAGGKAQEPENRPETGERQAEDNDSEQTPSPSFEQGEVQSIEIVGNRFRSDRYIRRKLGIREGETYLREDIAAAVDGLADDKLIEYASFSIDSDGHLRIHVYELQPFSMDFGLTSAYTRVSGFGIGPELQFSSEVTPISGLKGYLRYDWGSEDLAWGVEAERKFLPENHLVIGGGYRDDFGSNMEWAIPEADAHLNAFFIGRATQNYFRTENSYGFITLPQIWNLRTRFEYFENRYFSVSRETSWSLFNRNDEKRPNPPLDSQSEGFVTGTRLSLDFRNVTTVMDFRSRFEFERTYQGHAGGYPAYTRLFGYSSWNMRYWYGHLLKFRAVGGYSPHSLPDQRSFTLGGHNTLRGYDALSVPEPPSGETPFTVFTGGDRMFLVNVDYFYGEGASLIFFGDLGGVWSRGEPVTTSGLRRDVGIGIAFGSDFFSAVEDEHKAGFRINWAIPVGPVSHVSRWTVNFVRSY